LNIEKALITYVVRNNSAREIIERGIKSSLLNQKETQDQLKFIIDFYTNYHTTPTENVIQAKFPEYEPFLEDVSFDWVCDKIQEMDVWNKINMSMGKVSEFQTLREPYKSVEVLQQLLVNVSESSRRGYDKSWKGTAESRKEEYEEKAKKGGMIGIPTPIDSLNEVTGGICPGQYWIISGRAKSSKTWQLSRWAYHAMQLGYKVLFFSPEMNYTEIFQRLDAIYSVKSFKDLRLGRLDNTDKEEYFGLLDQANQVQGDIVVVSGDEGYTINSITAKVDRYNPDILFIDGLSLIDDISGGRTTVEALRNISRSIKKLASRPGKQLPVVVAAQQKRGSKKETADLEDLQWSDQLGQDADYAFGVYQTEEMQQSSPPTVEMKLIASRHSVFWSGTFAFNTDPMLFEQIGVSHSDDDMIEFDPQKF